MNAIDERFVVLPMAQLQELEQRLERAERDLRAIGLLAVRELIRRDQSSRSVRRRPSNLLPSACRASE